MKCRILAIFFLLSMPCLTETLFLEKPLVVVIPSYNSAQWYKKNLDSIFMQKYNNYRVIYIDDCSTDGTYELVKEYIKNAGQEDRVTLIRNTVNRGIFANHYRAVHRCHDDEIVLNVDADDWLIDDQVFNKINETYSNPDVWLTYGQFKSWPKDEAGFCKRSPKHVIERNGYRDFTWRASHMRTFYAWLFKRIKLKNCLCNGQMYPVCADMVMMYPMLEMAADTHLHVMDDVLYVYNEREPKNSLSEKHVQQLHCSRAIRNSEKYTALSADQSGGNSFDAARLSLVIASKSRPMQLWALLESLQKNVQNIGSVTVIYETDSAGIARAYQQIRIAFPDAAFVPINNCWQFKDALIDVVHRIPDAYIAFADDELVVRNPIDARSCIAWLEHTEAIAFYLGLGTNIHQSTVLNREQKQPPFIFLDDDLYAWELNCAEYDWRRFVSTDFAIYRKADIASMLAISFTDLAELQSQLALACPDADAIGLCFEHSAIVRPKFIGAHAGKDDLCELFNYGFKIDIEQFMTLINDRLDCPIKPLLKPRVERAYAT